MALSIFQSGGGEALRKLAKREYGSREERDQLLAAVLETGSFRAKEVMWMLFQPDRALREAGLELLQAHRQVATVDLFLVQSTGKPEAATRAAAAALFALRIPGIEHHLVSLVAAESKETQEAVRRLLLEAPPSATIAPVLWKLTETGTLDQRLAVLSRLALFELDAKSLTSWTQLARDDQRPLREKALTFLAEKVPSRSVDLFVEELPRASYAVQQVIVEALARVAEKRGADFAERILPLMAAGDAATRSAVLKILLGVKDRRDLVARYIRFSKTLAGWARDRALASMREFGDDLIEPTIELLRDEDEEVRASAMVVAGSFEDPRIVPATVRLLQDPDWWIRITAAETLGRLEDRRAVGALVAALEDEEVRWAAVEALGRIGDIRALSPLGKLLKDPSPEVRVEVILALRNFEHPKVLEVLRSLAEKDPNRAVRSRALEVAEEVAERDHSDLEDAEGLRTAALKAQTKKGEPRLHALLVATRNQGASDFHLSVSQPPMLRVAAELRRGKGEPYTAEQTERMLREILTDEQWLRLETEQQLDFCYYMPSGGRYRANIFLDQKGYNAVFRVIPEKPPTIHEIGLPAHLAEIASYHQGLVVVCGPSGSGKSTTLAALVNLFNETRHDHILTLEDPVEFVHPFKNCLVNQREVGSHTRSFARALRGALREDPDVIVIGDLRDGETVSLALTAAETGHIVLATLNSTSAHKAIDRIISSFPTQEQQQIRTALSESIKYVVAQRLLPSKQRGKLVACFEVLKGINSIANLIRDEKTFLIPSTMQIARGQGMQTLDEALRGLVKQGSISGETAYLAADKKEDFESLVPQGFLDAGTFL